MANLLARLLKMTGRHTPQPGDYYSILYASNGVRVAKVLATDDTGLHLRIFADDFEERPASIDAAGLRLGYEVREGEENGLAGFLEALSSGVFLGMGHMPVRWETFQGMEPVFIQDGIVEDSELEGYYEWENANGGYW